MQYRLKVKMAPKLKEELMIGRTKTENIILLGPTTYYIITTGVALNSKYC